MQTGYIKINMFMEITLFLMFPVYINLIFYSTLPTKGYEKVE